MRAPEAVTSVAGRVEARLADLLDGEVSRWAGVDGDLAAPFGALRDYVLSGGKRLRPAFCHWAFRGAGGGADDPVATDAGAALEMLHTAALVHDDVIDRSERRHDGDTVHVRFAAEHHRRGWSGDDGHFGEGVAIIVGDLALVYSSRLLAAAPAAARRVFEEMRLEVNVGQYLDVLGAAEGVLGGAEGVPGAGAAVARAERICRYKTAKYTVERPLHLGAALAAPDRFDELAPGLSAFGLPLGEAFQLRDDLLGVFGDPDVTGKPVGDDLREGKPTRLAGLAAAALTGADAARFAAAFGDPGLDATGVAALQSLIEASGARQQVEARIAGLMAAAGAALAALPLDPVALGPLADLSAFVTGRDH